MEFTQYFVTVCFCFYSYLTTIALSVVVYVSSSVVIFIVILCGHIVSRYMAVHVHYVLYAFCFISYRRWIADYILFARCVLLLVELLPLLASSTPLYFQRHVFSGRRKWENWADVDSVIMW